MPVLSEIDGDTLGGGGGGGGCIVLHQNKEFLNDFRQLCSSRCTVEQVITSTSVSMLLTVMVYRIKGFIQPFQH